MKRSASYRLITISACSSRPPLWSSGQSFWLQIRQPGFDSRHYEKKKVVGLERGSLSLVGTTEELLDRKVAVPVYKIENTAVGIRHADHVAASIRKKLAITSPTSGGRPVGIVRSRTHTMEFRLDCSSIHIDRCSIRHSSSHHTESIVLSSVYYVSSDLLISHSMGCLLLANESRSLPSVSRAITGNGYDVRAILVQICASPGRGMQTQALVSQV
jgi:hypothetical protein